MDREKNHQRQDSKELLNERVHLKRRPFGVKLNAIKVVKMNVFIYQSSGFLKGCWFFNTNTFTFEYAEEVLGHGIVVRIFPS